MIHELPTHRHRQDETKKASFLELRAPTPAEALHRVAPTPLSRERRLHAVIRELGWTRTGDRRALTSHVDAETSSANLWAVAAILAACLMGCGYGMTW